jgi:hypothetical protein
MSTKPTNLKQTPIPVVPRTLRIVNPDGTVTRSGQLLLQQLQPQSATQGTHATRPDAAGANVPDGALYTESDRTVLYYAAGGQWYYLAGEMYGTLKPDQRPTDLGVNDAGFFFRATDNDPQYSGREFGWSGGNWIEVTPALWGAHSARLALTIADQINGELYVEADRSGVIYQLQGSTWHFLAGAMYGTLSPDQRPAGLGPNDAGFTFRTTDTAANYRAREFIWSGGEWVETTRATFGGHTDRLAIPIVNIASGEIYAEADRSGVIYQLQGSAWHFLAGTMWGTVSPDARPTDLGTNDAGFTFRGTDQQRQFIWSGTAWVETTPVGTPSTLSHPNVVTKVGSTPGQIVEGGITDLSAGNSNKVTITAGGSVGIGAVPVAPLNVVAPSSAAGPAAGQLIVQTSSGGTAEQLVLGVHDGDYSYLQAVKPGTALRNLLLQPDGGNCGIGTTSPAYNLQLAVDSAAKPLTSTWTIASDGRLKRNVQDLVGGLDVITKLRPIEAEYNGAGGMPEGRRVVSFLAEEVRQILPGCVSSYRGKLQAADTQETDILDFNIHEVLMHLVLAVKQLGAEVEMLKQQGQA